MWRCLGVCRLTAATAFGRRDRTHDLVGVRAAATPGDLSASTAAGGTTHLDPPSTSRVRSETIPQGVLDHHEERQQVGPSTIER